MHSNSVKWLANRLSVDITQYNRGAGLRAVVSSGAAQHKGTAIIAFDSQTHTAPLLNKRQTGFLFFE